MRSHHTNERRNGLIWIVNSLELETQSVGGQETPLPGKFYVPLEMTLQAARYFYRHRTPDPALQWVAPNFEKGD